MYYPKVLNLSLPKTGSTSIYQAFLEYGARHEGFHDVTVNKIIDYREGSISCRQLNVFLARRQNLLKTIIDSNTFMHLIPCEIEALYPPATVFVQVIRHPCHWARSYLSMLHEVGRDVVNSQNLSDKNWTSRYAAFQAKSLEPIRLFTHPEDLTMLIKNIEDLCVYWKDSINRVQNSISRDRLCIAPIEKMPDVINFIAYTIKHAPSHLPHANKSLAEVSTQDNFQRACDLAIQKSDIVKGALDTYRLKIEQINMELAH